jgi:hypothetical protein
MTTDPQLPLFPDPDERAKRQRIVAERMAELELNQMYPPARRMADAQAEYCPNCGYWPRTFGRHRSTCPAGDQPLITSYDPDELWAAECRRLNRTSGRKPTKRRTS